MLLSQHVMTCIHGLFEHPSLDFKQCKNCTCQLAYRFHLLVEAAGEQGWQEAPCYKPASTGEPSKIRPLWDFRSFSICFNMACRASCTRLVASTMHCW